MDLVLLDPDPDPGGPKTYRILRMRIRNTGFLNHSAKDLGTAKRSRGALRVVFIELEGRVWLYGGHHAGGEEAGGRLHVLESLLLVQQRRELDPRNKAARQQ
jgi:hypothetical protein